jgi:hypothetical protein
MLTILSGGQTGADRAALDWALAHGIAHGGWCPKGRWAEDGPIPLHYQLRETPSSQAAQRTEFNVRDSDATVIFSIKPTLTGGSLRTAQVARRLGKPLLHLAREDSGFESHGSGFKVQGSGLAERLRAFVREHQVSRLNVAGPRASQEPEIGGFVKQMLEQLRVG